jgi:hypothetical protein
MIMKRVFATALLVASLSSVNALAGGDTDPNSPLTQEQVEQMINRIDEIKEMDKSELSRKERKELRREVREIKHRVAGAHTHGGIYISAGAVIIILLLIILL